MGGEDTIRRAECRLPASLLTAVKAAMRTVARRLLGAAGVVLLWPSHSPTTTTTAHWAGDTLTSTQLTACETDPCWSGHERCCGYIGTSLWASDPTNERVVYFDGA